MASEMVVNKALKAFANNYNKTDRWIEETQRLWARGLADIHDKDLVRGVEVWCKNRRTPPNLARLREMIEAGPRVNPAKVLNGCPACDNTGWREMSRFYEKNQKTHVTNVVAACDCPKGSRLMSATVFGFESVLQQWRADPFTDAIHFSTAQQPHLTTEQRVTPERLEQMKQRANAPQTETASGWKALMR